MALDLFPRAVDALARAKDETLSDAARLDACRVLYATMAQLASSPCSSLEQREFTQWQAEVWEQVSAGLPHVLRTMADLSRAADDIAIRREAARFLESASHKLRELGRDVANWQVKDGEVVR
jgi:hypothetical protein